MARQLCLLVLVLAVLSPCRGYYNYQTRIPNGQYVPHSCKPNFIWHGVGHVNPLGGGERNQFGKDFARLGHKWSPDLCRLDSDGDGWTNGEELGDPSCVWREGLIPQQTDNITHPGICDPWGSARCNAHNTWVTCDVGDFVCDAIHEPGVQSLELHFPRTKVPAKDTTYSCFVFDIPHDQPYHLIAFEAAINNPNVMHHMVVTACDETAELVSEPQECNMGIKGCAETIAVWTLGMPGDCFHRDTGFRFGKGAARRIAIQHHWTNMQHIDHWYDSSGIKLYYTPRLRPYDAAVMTIGQTHLDIPPASNVVISGSCSPTCTNMYFKEPVKVVAGLNHMHYLGVGGRLEVIRNGRVVYNLTNDQPYSYDSPHVYYYTTPVVVNPGDELKMVCEYASRNRNYTVHYGLGSYEEMCYGLLTYYPKQTSLTSCVQWKEMDICKFSDKTFLEEASSAFNSSIPRVKQNYDKIFEHCNLYGECTEDCKRAVAEVKATSVVYGDSVWEYMKTSLWENRDMNYADLLRYIQSIDICDRVSGAVTSTSGTHHGCPQTQPATSGEGGEGGHSGRGGEEGGSQKPTSTLQGMLGLAKELGGRPFLQNIIFNINEHN